MSFKEGPGKYDDYATYVRIMTQAKGVAVMVFGGTKGSGFSVQVEDRELEKELPDLLEFIAKGMRERAAGGD